MKCYFDFQENLESFSIASLLREFSIQLPYTSRMKQIIATTKMF